MADTSKITEHMEVLGSDGQHVGVVDHVESNSLKLTKNDPAAGGQHHRLPIAWVGHVDAHVHLNKSAAEAMQGWTTVDDGQS